MTSIERNRMAVIQSLEDRKEAKRMAEINRKLAEDEAAYRAKINRQMAWDYLFDAINKDNHKRPTKHVKEAIDVTAIPVVENTGFIKRLTTIDWMEFFLLALAAIVCFQFV